MIKSSSSIEKKVVMVPKIIPTDFKKIPTLIPIKHELINGKYIPTKFRKGIKYIPTDYKKIEMPKLITISNATANNY